MNLIYNYEMNIISEEYELKSALERLDYVNIKVLFITREERLVASLTDGDVRRAILSGSSLKTPVLGIANKNPVYLMDESLEMISKIMNEKGISAIPIVDEDMHIEKIYANYVLQDSSSNYGRGIPIVIMAGGKGTRLYPYTKVLPKPLIPIADIPIVERIIQSFQKIGCDTFHMIVNYKKNMIKSYFNDENPQYNVLFWDEEKPLGTGGGLFLLKDCLDTTFVLTNCDIIITENLSKIIEHHKNECNSVTMVCSLKKFEIPYGVVNFGDGGKITSFEEKPTFSFFTNTGCYVLEPEVLSYIRNEEVVGMPEIIDKMRMDGKKVGIYPIGENAWLDMGQLDSMESMERRFRELNLE